MFRSLRRRALVAIIAALGLVVGAAAPAHAAYSLLYSNSAGQGGVAWGYGYVYNDGLYIGIQGHPYKYYTGGPVDEYTCVETWVDLRASTHRPPDLFVNCKDRNAYLSSPVNGYAQWPTSGGAGGGGYVLTSQLNSGVNVVTCRVSVGSFVRLNPGSPGSTCYGSGVDVQAYSAYHWDQLMSLGNWNELQYFGTGPDFLWSGETLYGGELLVSWDGRWRLVQQFDGNLVMYNNATGSPIWATGTYGNNEARTVMQSDGNLVVYTSGGTPIWATGTSGHPGARLVLQNDRNLVLYSAGWQALWASGTCCF